MVIDPKYLGASRPMLLCVTLYTLSKKHVKNSENPGSYKGVISKDVLGNIANYTMSIASIRDICVKRKEKCKELKPPGFY